MSEDKKILISVLICYNILLLISMCFNYLYYKYSESKFKYNNYFKFINDSDNGSFGFMIFSILNIVVLIGYITCKIYDIIYKAL